MRKVAIVSATLFGTLVLWMASAAGQTPDAPSVRVEVAENVSPRLLPGEVASIVEKAHTHGSRLAPGLSKSVSPLRVSKLTCLKGAAYREAVPNGLFAKLPWDTVWVAEIQGRMVKTTPHGNVAVDRGFYVVDDATGQIVARGALGR